MIPRLSRLACALLLVGCTDQPSTGIVASSGPPRGIEDSGPATDRANGRHYIFPFAVAANRRSQVNAWFSLNANCSPHAYFTVRMLAPPRHGTLSIERGRYYPNFAPPNQRAACNLHPQDAVAAFYQPAPGYAGPDAFTILVITPDGRSWTTEFRIAVK